MHAAIQYVPEGWITPDSGYWMPEADGRDMLTAWRTDREEKLIYQAALEESDARTQQLKELVTEEFAAIKEAHEADRRQWQKELRRSRAPGIGVFAGIGYTTDQSWQGVVGAGIVYKVW